MPGLLVTSFHACNAAARERALDSMIDSMIDSGKEAAAPLPKKPLITELPDLDASRQSRSVGAGRAKIFLFS